jgi:hypothetical protein
MAPSDPIELLQQMAAEFKIIARTQIVTEDMLKDYQNHGPVFDPEQSENLRSAILQFKWRQFIDFAKETRTTLPTSTDLVMRLSFGCVWDTGGGHYF